MDGKFNGTVGDFVGSSSGTWAGKRFLEQGLKLASLRTNDALRRDEWVHFDTAVIEEATIRLTGVADLISAGLTMPIANALGKTMIELEKVTDLTPAIRSMSPRARSTDDRVDFTQFQVPNYVTHKDFDIDLRTLEASRDKGEPLSTTQVRLAARRVAESLEDALFNGSGVTVNGVTAPGYRTHPDRNTLGFDATHWGDVAKTGESILKDVLAAISALEAKRMYGPYWIYVPTNASAKLSDDFKANSDKTIRQRIQEIDQISAVRVADQLPSANVLFVQATRDVVELADGESVQTVQWDIDGGFVLKFKVMAIQVPIIKSDAGARCGVLHMS